MGKMTDGIRSMARFSWAMSLFGVQQTAELMAAFGGARSPRRAAASFDAVARAAADQLEAGPRAAYRDGDRWLGELLDDLFNAADPLVDASRELASRTLVRGSLLAFRQSAAIFEVTMPGGSPVAWQELLNKLEAFDHFQYAERILDADEDLLADSLHDKLERAGRHGPYLELWLTEGLGFAVAEAAWEGGEPRRLLCRPELAELPVASLIPLHTGMGLSLARRLIPDLEPPAEPAGVAAALERFARLCRDNARDGYALAAYEALGLVVRQLAPGAASGIDRQLARAGERSRRGAFWHGFGRGLYFAASQALPGSLGRAAGRARREAPVGIPRRNALSGLAWAVTLVNFRQPSVLEAWLDDQRFADDEAGAVGRGIASAVLLWLESAGKEHHFEAFNRHRPASTERWRRMVTEPIDRAFAGWSGVKSGPGPGEIFHDSPTCGDDRPASRSEPAAAATDLVREVDGEVGRIVSWLAQGASPSRRAAPAAAGSEPEAEPRAVSSEASIRGRHDNGAAGRAPAVQTEQAAAAEQVARPQGVAEAEPAAPAGEEAAAVDPLAQKVLDALAASEEGAAIGDLRRLTGGKATTLRARLRSLIESGRVERRGAGMRTRYHLVSEDDG